MAKNQDCKQCYGVSCPHWIGCFPELVSDIKQLEAELGKAKFVIGKFEEWSSDTGCPLSETKEGFCPCYDELKKEYEKTGGIPCEFEPGEWCDFADNPGHCYARYYEKLFEEQALKVKKT